MKLLLTALPLVLLVGCASAPHEPTKVGNGNYEINKMQRIDVIGAARECINSHMKPVVQSVPQPTDHGTILVPVAVNCFISSMAPDGLTGMNSF